jgi:hypothetical protein
MSRKLFNHLKRDCYCVFVPMPRKNERKTCKYIRSAIALVALVAFGVVWTVTVCVTTGLRFHLADLLFSEAQHLPSVNP